MYRTFSSKYYSMAAFAVFGFTIFLNPLVAQQRVTPSDDEIEILTRGPVHEAFAETIVFDPEPGLVIPRSPPAAIEELPPRDLRTQRERFARGGTGADDSFRVGTTLEELTNAKALPHRIQPLASDTRQQLGKRSVEIRALNEQRLKLESGEGGHTGGPPDSKAAPVRTRIPRSKIVGSPIQKLAPGKAPPKIIPVPIADPKIQPKPRPPRADKGHTPVRGKGNDGEGRGKGGKGVDKGGKGVDKGEKDPS